MPVPLTQALDLNLRISVPTLIAPVIFCIASCDAPGEGPSADAGRALSRDVIAALDRFEEEQTHYPQELTDLYPKYIKTRIKMMGTGDTEGIFFAYWPQQDGTYYLRFRYFGPGVNDCVYVFGSHPDKWECSGHY